MLTRSFPRFLIQAALLIVVAAIAAAIHLGPLTIVLVVAAAFGIVVGTEWLATRESKPKQEGPDRSRGAPAPIPAASVRPAPIPPPAASPPVVQGRRWNVFELQNRARTIADKDYLCEFADTAGDLKEEFDTFVHESFPELLPT